MAMMLSVENSPMGDAAISFYSAAFVSADELLKPNSVAVTTMIPSPILPDTSRWSATAICGGTNFLLSSTEHRDLFATDPQRFAQQYGDYRAFSAPQQATDGAAQVHSLGWQDAPASPRCWSEKSQRAQVCFL